MTLGKMRGYNAGRHGERGDEKLGSFLWSSTAMMHLCTLAVLHGGTCDKHGHGWRHFLNKMLQLTHFSSTLHHTSSSISLQRSLASPPSYFLSPFASTLISLLYYLLSISPETKLGGEEEEDELCYAWKQHLPGWLSLNRFMFLSPSLWAGTQRSCHVSQDALSITDYVRWKDEYPLGIIWLSHKKAQTGPVTRDVLTGIQHEPFYFSRFNSNKWNAFDIQFKIASFFF